MVGLAYGLDPDGILDTKTLWQFQAMGAAAAKWRRYNLRDAVTAVHVASPREFLQGLNRQDNKVRAIEGWKMLAAAMGDMAMLKRMDLRDRAARLLKKVRNG